MNRFFEIRAIIKKDDDEIVLPLYPDEIAKFALEVSLLDQDLVESITLLDSEKMKLKISKDKEKPEPALSEIRQLSELSYLVEIPANHCHQLSRILLQTYRDGMFSVNHIHFEGILDDNSFDFTLFFRK